MNLHGPAAPQPILGTLQCSRDLSRSQIFSYHYHRLLHAPRSFGKPSCCSHCTTKTYIAPEAHPSSSHPGHNSDCNFCPLVSPHTPQTPQTLMGVQLSLAEPRRSGSLPPPVPPQVVDRSVISMPLELSWPLLLSSTHSGSVRPAA